MTDENFPTENGPWEWVACSPKVFREGRKARVFFRPFSAGENVGQADTEHPNYRGFEGTVRSVSKDRLLIVNEDRNKWLSVILDDEGNGYDELIRPDGQKVGRNINFECLTMKDK